MTGYKARHCRQGRTAGEHIAYEDDVWGKGSEWIRRGIGVEARGWADAGWMIGV